MSQLRSLWAGALAALLALGGGVWLFQRLDENRGTSLHLWHAYRGGEEKALLESCARFTAETGTPVELLSVPYDALSAKLTNAIPHGAGPDVFIFAHERLRQFERLKMIVPSDGLLDQTVYLKPAVDALEVDGVHYGYPLSLKTLALYFNTELVKEPPHDTRQLDGLLQQLSKPDENRFGLAYEAGDFYYHAAILQGFGGGLFGPDGKADFDTPAMARSMAFVKHLLDERWMPQEASGALVKTLFNDGRAAMVISGPWFAGEIDPRVHYAVAPLPVVAETGEPMHPFLGVEAALVSTSSPHRELAQQLARFLSRGEATLLRTTVGEQIPAEVSAYDDPKVAGNALFSSFRRAAEQARPTPNTLEMARVWEPMKLALRAVLQGSVSPEEAGKLATRRYNALNRTAPKKAEPTLYLVLGALGLAGLVAWRWRRRSPEPLARRYPDSARGLAFVAPAAAGILVLVVVPLVVGVSLSLFHHEAGEYTFVGLANFTDILTSHGYRITEPLSFYFTLAVTLLWTFVNVALHVTHRRWRWRCCCKDSAAEAEAACSGCC